MAATPVETIEQFVSNLETNFKPDDLIDFNIADLKYIVLKPINNIVYSNDDGSRWALKDQKWDCLIVSSGSTQVSEVISTLKEFLPQHKDDILLTLNSSGKYGLLFTTKFVTMKRFVPEVKGSYGLNHPRIVKHNQSFLSKDFWTRFSSKTDTYAKLGKDTKSNLKFAQYLLIDQNMTQPLVEILPPYFYLNKFYQTGTDVWTTYPDAEELEFTLYKGIMVQVGLVKSNDAPPTPKEKIYWIDSDSFTMKYLINNYTLTESQLIKFFVEQDGKLTCQHPDIIKTFEK